MARTRALDYNDKQEAILKSAASLFGEHGFERVSMASVAADCGFSKALLYHYYSSKEALLDDIIMRHLERLIAAVSTANASGNEPRDRLLAMVGAVLNIYQEDADQHRVQQGSQVSMSAAKQDTMKALERTLVQQFADALSQAVPRLQEKPEALLPVTMSLFGMMNWTYTWFKEGGAVDRTRYAEIVTTLMLDGANAL
jgi:TetR/AcrR family transcriptional regulator